MTEQTATAAPTEIAVLFHHPDDGNTSDPVPVAAKLGGHVLDWPVEGLAFAGNQSLVYRDEEYLFTRLLGIRPANSQGYRSGALYRKATDVLDGLWQVMVEVQPLDEPEPRPARPFLARPPRQEHVARQEAERLLSSLFAAYARATLCRHDGRDWQPVATIDSNSNQWQQALAGGGD